MQLHIKLKFFFDFTEIKLGMAWAFDDMITNAAHKTTFIDSIPVHRMESREVKTEVEISM